LKFNGHEDSDFKRSVTPEIFNEIFSPKGRQNPAKGKVKHSYVISSSFDRTSENPYQFQVFLFFKEAVTTVMQFEAAYQYVYEKLEQNNYLFPENGLNPDSINWRQAHWMLGTNEEHKESAFFGVMGIDKSRDVYERYGLNLVE
jgi:hypothetical protein